MSKLHTLNLERNFISLLDFSLPNNVEILRLAENNITRFYSNPPSNIQTFTLSHNPWQCDCDTLPFRKWMLAEISKILDVNETRCSFEDRENMRGRVIIALSEIELCPKLIRNYILMGVGGAVILMMTVAFILLYFRYQYHLKVWLYSRGWRCFKKRDKRDDGKLFDAYISFTDEDAARVRKYFLPELEEKHPFYKLFVPQRDLKAGNFEINYLMERVVDSKRTVILLTKRYLRNEFCMEIFRVAFANSLEEKLHRIILVKFGPLPPMKEMDQSLKIVMESSMCLKFRQKLFWEMLRYEMPEKSPNIDDYELLDDQTDDVPLIQEL
ncbi:protein toll-like isoform X1 [Parasteatoda tepidariorum]|uniref:protein toll-like isoform X1 n=1 Tax=Parasteatoda tepidariorum TaxID=114398 RepID=UPI001C71B969|nr:protein toll-like [Parasteatoda tepidariorum]